MSSRRRSSCRNFFFFFQAEDGIRCLTVTGVQTWALPIWSRARGAGPMARGRAVPVRALVDRDRPAGSAGVERDDAEACALRRVDDPRVRAGAVGDRARAADGRPAGGPQS